MNKEDLAAKMDKSEYAMEDSRLQPYLAEAKVSRLVVVFGASDDLVEFRGAVYDECGAGAADVAIFVDRAGLLPHWEDVNEDEAEAEQFFARKKIAQAITASWCKKGEPFTWTFETDIPHATFEVYEDEGRFCQGIVFSLEDLKEA